MSAKTKKKASSVLLYIFIVLFVGSIILPFIWLLLGSFKIPRELFSVPPQILPSALRFDNYIEAYGRQTFGRFIWNSAVTATISTTLSITCAIMASYSIARVDIRGKKFILGALLSITLLPPVTLLNPLYQMMANLNLLNTQLGLGLVIMVVEMPLAVWFLTGFFQSIPYEMEESAMIDGASIRTMFTHILLPLIAPGIFTVSILIFINSWNQFLYALVLNPMTRARTVTVALTMFQVDNTIPWHIVSAASISIVAPLIVIILVLQKKIISGMLEGSVKG